MVRRVKWRHVFVIAPARDLRAQAGWRLKSGRQEVGQSKPVGRGSFTIALCVHNLARVAGARIRIGEPPRVDASLVRLGLAREIASRQLPKLFVFVGAPLLIAALAVSGCAPVGPNFERPAAIVSPQFKEIKGWKIATPRANEPKGEWWSVFHDPELAQLMRVVVVSNQTIKADEANFRQGLALINEARAGLFPSINGTGAATRSSPAQTTLTAEASGAWTLDIWGQIRREIEFAAGWRGDERGHSRKRHARRAIGARARLCHASRGGFARGPARRDHRRLQAFGHDHAKSV